MTYFIAYFGYNVAYFSIACIPFIVISAVLNLILGDISDLVRLLLIVVFTCIFLLSGYRAKLAADIYCINSYKWIDAHITSEEMFKSQITLLPLIRVLFRKAGK